MVLSVILVGISQKHKLNNFVIITVAVTYYFFF